MSTPALPDENEDPKRTVRFTFMNTPEERDMIDELARLLARTPSDAVRVAVRRLLDELKEKGK